MTGENDGKLERVHGREPEEGGQSRERNVDDGECDHCRCVGNTGSSHQGWLAKPGGLTMVLDYMIPMENGARERVIARELDIESPKVADFLLCIISSQERQGSLNKVRYRTCVKGRPLSLEERKPLVKFRNEVAPPLFRPVFLGAFLEDGTYLGFTSMLEDYYDFITLGAIIQEEFRGKGLCTALFRACMEVAGKIYLEEDDEDDDHVGGGDENVDENEKEKLDFLFITGKNNEGMQGVARKLGMFHVDFYHPYYKDNVIFTSTENAGIRYIRRVGDFLWMNDFENYRVFIYKNMSNFLVMRAMQELPIPDYV